MSRYFTTRPVVRHKRTSDGWFDDEPPMIPNLTVSDHEPVNTGLVDQRGDPIMRAPYPIGFGRDGEW